MPMYIICLHYLVLNPSQGPVSQNPIKTPSLNYVFQFGTFQLKVDWIIEIQIYSDRDVN